MFFGLAHRVGWTPDTGFFDRFTDGLGNRPKDLTLRRIGQGAMLYKLGRSPRVPVDTNAFSLSHRLTREMLLLNQRQNATDGNGGWSYDVLAGSPEVVNLSGDEFIQYLFLATVQRRPSAEEMDVLQKIVIARKYAADRNAQAMVVFDYLSRLPELYAFREGRSGSR
jgi:hypothetical protein